MPEIVRFVLRLPEGIHAAITELAERDHRSLNGEIVYILERFAAEERARTGEAQEGPSAGKELAAA